MTPFMGIYLWDPCPCLIKNLGQGHFGPLHYDELISGLGIRVLDIDLLPLENPRFHMQCVNPFEGVHTKESQGEAFLNP